MNITKVEHYTLELSQEEVDLLVRFLSEFVHEEDDVEEFSNRLLEELN